MDNAAQMQCLLSRETATSFSSGVTRHQSGAVVRSDGEQPGSSCKVIATSCYILYKTSRCGPQTRSAQVRLDIPPLLDPPFLRTFDYTVCLILAVCSDMCRPKFSDRLPQLGQARILHQ
jgi:hypothetical protein